MIEMRCNTTFLFMWHHWHQQNIKPMVSWMTPTNALLFFIIFIKMRWNKTFCSCDTIGISIKWCWQCWKLCHWIPLVKTIKMRSDMTFWPYQAIGIGITWYQWHTILMSAPVPAKTQTSFNASKQSFQHDKCKDVIYGTTSTMWQEICHIVKFGWYNLLGVVRSANAMSRLAKVKECLGLWQLLFRFRC